MLNSTADIVIIGAGVIGLSAALQLRRAVDQRIVVLDRGSGPGAGSSGASSAVCRHLYTYDEMVQLAREGIDVYRRWSEFTSLPQPRAHFRETGVLWMGTDDAAASARRLAGFGIAATELDAADLRIRFPDINPCQIEPDFVTGEEHRCVDGERFLLEEGGGYIDPQAVLEDLLEALRARDVIVRFSTPVADIEHVNQGVTGVRLANGERVHAPVVLNASGPWCNSLLRPFAFADRWPLVPTRIQVLHLPLDPQVCARLPVCGDFRSGVYFRPQGVGQLIAGSTLEQDEQEAVRNPDVFDPFADETFVRIKMHALVHRLPAVSDRVRAGSYCGLYTVNRADMHPLVGATPVQGLYAANGFSGHGFKLAPAIGALLARAICGDSNAPESAISDEFLSWQRQVLPMDTFNVLA